MSTTDALTSVSLCTGYSGLDMAVDAVYGATMIAYAEHEPVTEKNPKPTQAAAHLLAYRYPGVPNLGDLSIVDWSGVRASIVTAGYPCQPDSLAGKGLSTDDDRYLWPEVARCIGVVGPQIVVLENVYGHFVRGFAGVLGSLTDLGYDTRWTTLRAADVGAPHRRERLFVIAENANGAAGGQWRQSAPGQAKGRRSRADTGGRGGAPAADSGGDGRPRRQERNSGPNRPELGPSLRDDAHGCAVAPSNAASDRRDEWRPESARFIRGQDAAKHWASTPDPDSDAVRLKSIGELGGSGEAITGWGSYEAAIRRWERVLGRVAPSPTEANTKGGQRLSPPFVEWMMGLPAGWVTDVPGISRNDQLKMLGNGVVPQQASAALRVLVGAGLGYGEAQQ